MRSDRLNSKYYDTYIDDALTVAATTCNAKRVKYTLPAGYRIRDIRLEFYTYTTAIPVVYDVTDKDFGVMIYNWTGNNLYNIGFRLHIRAEKGS